MIIFIIAACICMCVCGFLGSSLVGSGPGNSIAFRPFEKSSTAFPRLFFKCTGKTVEVDRRRLGLDPRQTKELDLVYVALPERSDVPVQDGRTVVSVSVVEVEVRTV